MLAPDDEYMATGQDLQVDDAIPPVIAEYRPATQLKQLNAPVVVWYVPAVHVTHDDPLIAAW